MTDSPENLVQTIRRKTRKKHHPEEKIRIVLEGLRGEESIAELRRRESIAQMPILQLEQEVPHHLTTCKPRKQTFISGTGVTCAGVVTGAIDP